MNVRKDIIGLDRNELETVLANLGIESFRARQVWSWVYCHGSRRFEDMSNLAKPVRAMLAEHFIISRPAIIDTQISKDGTCKWLLRLNDGQEIECVHIPEKTRGALCVSSQVGCPMGCRFCRTGTQKFVRNLTVGEIIGQVLLARDELKTWLSTKEQRTLSNIVLMGMGEPLNNFENVAKAVKIIMHPDGIAIGRRKITLSTSGLAPMIKRCGEELGVNLAVSLHAVTDEVRDKLMPINRKYPIRELLQVCREYPGAGNSRRITFEYVMLKGINDSSADARALVKLLAGIPAKINLLHYNPWPGSPYESSDEETVRKFADIVNRAGYVSPIRVPRGRDIMAACGQLRSASVCGRKNPATDWVNSMISPDTCLPVQTMPPGNSC